MAVRTAGRGIMIVVTLSPLENALARYWGYTAFRPLQREAMEAVACGPRLAGRAADWRRQVTLLSGARRRTSWPRGGGLPAHLADEGSSGHAGGQRRACGAVQQLADIGRERGDRRGAPRRTLPPAVRLARAPGRRRERGVSHASRVVRCQLSSPWTRRIASASGGTISDRSTVNSLNCASGCPASACRRTRPPPPPASGATSPHSLA